MILEGSHPFWKVLPHVFILGAGASRAAFPYGDKNHNLLPLMKDFVPIVGLEDLLQRHSLDYDNQNIEEIYSNLHLNISNKRIIESINNRIISYFTELQLPDEVTLYDELLLTLQKKDAIFSFNWDPLLLQAYARNRKIKELPSVHFLHGNVYVGVCYEHKNFGYRYNSCPVCKKLFSPSKILFPIKEKNYKNDEFIKNEWKLLAKFLSNSFLLTIFGYSAPTTDVEARRAMKEAWLNNKRTNFNEIDIIDIRDEKEVKQDWNDFIYEEHTGIFKDIRKTQSFKYPRRSCESFGEAIMQCDPWYQKPLPRFTDLHHLHNWVENLIEEEINFRNNDIPLPKFEM